MRFLFLKRTESGGYIVSPRQGGAFTVMQKRLDPVSAFLLFIAMLFAGPSFAAEPADPHSCKTSARLVLSKEIAQITYPEWVPRAQAGDIRAREVLAAHLVLVLTSRLSRDSRVPRSDVDDMVQDILLKVFTSLGTYDADRSTFLTWVFHVSNRWIIDTGRMNNRAKRSGNITDDPDVLSLQPARPSRVDVEGDEELAELMAAIEDLPEVLRTTLQQYLITPTYKATGEALGVSEATAFRRVVQARNAILEAKPYLKAG